MENDFKKAMALGDYEFESKNFESAHAYFVRAIEIDFESAEAWYKRARAAGHIGNLSDLHSAYDKAIELTSSRDQLSVITAWYYGFLAILMSAKVANVFNHIDNSAPSERDLVEITSIKSTQIYLDKECEKFVEFITIISKGLINDNMAIPAIDNIFDALNDVRQNMDSRIGELATHWKGISVSILYPVIDNISDFVAYKAGISIDPSLEDLVIDEKWKAIYGGPERLHGQR